MNNLVKKFSNFIGREIKEENEPKDTAVLIRTLCLVDMIFLTGNSIFMWHEYDFYGFLSTFVTSLLIWCVFALSYKVKMNVLVYLYYFAIAINVIVLVGLVGLSYMFQAQMYVVFILFFYRAAGKQWERNAAVLGSLIIVGIIIHCSSIYGYLYDVTPYSNPLVVWFCTLYIIAKSGMMARAFRQKFSSSEEKIIKYSKRLEMLATTDPLTNLQNRRGMLKHIEEYVVENKNINNQATIVIGDIDFFKHINDTYGHEAGDYVLETLAKIMNDFMEGKGMVARWGGEEFLFCLEGINGDFAFEEISKLLHLIERYEFVFNGTQINVTMTFGVEEYDDYIGIDKVISKADEKLYMGKEQGRNRVIY